MNDLTAAVALIERQLVAYNARDLDGFIACYSPDIKVLRMPTQEAAITGREALSEFYRTQRFNLDGLHADIVNRISMGNKVIDHEMVSGLTPDKAVELVAVYEVYDGLIKTVWFYYP